MHHASTQNAKYIAENCNSIFHLLNFVVECFLYMYMITQVCGMLKPGLYPEIGRKILNYCEPQSHTDPVATTTTSITSSSGCITTNIN